MFQYYSCLSAALNVMTSSICNSGATTSTSENILLRKLIKDFGSKGIPSVDDSLWTGLLDLVLLELRVPFKSQLISLKTRNQKFAVTLRAFYRWGQGRGERHNWFVTKYPYHEVKAGFGSDFVSAEMYGHILQWLGQSLTRRLVRDKRAAWHCILYVAIKEVIIFLAEKLTGRTYSSINPECQRTELHSKEL